MNLLDHFILQHCQVSVLKGELLRVSREGAMQDAKVEMNLTPRLMEMDSGDKLPSYQVKQHWHERYHNEPGNMWLRGVMLQLFAA